MKFCHQNSILVFLYLLGVHRYVVGQSTSVAPFSSTELNGGYVRVCRCWLSTIDDPLNPSSSVSDVEEPTMSVSASVERTSSVSVIGEPTRSFSASVEPTNSVSISEEPTISVSASVEPTSRVSASEEPTSSVSASEEPISVSASEEPIGSTSASEVPISSTSSSEEPISSTSVSIEPTSRFSDTEEPTSSVSASEEPISSTSASEEPIGSLSVQHSSSSSSILPSPMPSPLAAPSITNITSMITAFRVEWNFTQCTLPSFEIKIYRPADGINPAILVTTLKTSETLATVRDLSSSAQYDVSIRGYCDDVPTDFSGLASVITLPQPSFDNSRVTVERLADGTGEVTLSNGMTVAVDDSLKDSNSYFGEIYGHLFLLDVSFFNSRRLLPYGTEYGDTVYTFSYYRYYYSSRYYGIQHILSDPLPFFGKDFSLLYLNYFGFVSVGQPYNNPWNRLPFPLTGNVPIVSAMWWWYYSSIYLHEYNIGSGQGYDDAVIDLVQNRLQRYHGVTLDFKPDKVVSITWSLDYVYIGYTAQLLLVSDGIKTYAIISYDDNNWNFPYWYSRYSWYRRSGPVIGYSGGDGINFKTLDVEYWNLDKIRGNTGVVGVWVFPMFNTASNKEVEAQARCKLWYEKNKHLGPVDFVAESSLNACPCTMEQAERNWRIGWSWGFRYSSRERCTVLWWPRRNNWRWWRTEPIGSKECCYDESGNLIVGSKLGGTSKKYHFYYESALHISQDYTPYLDCCVLTSKTKFCNYYYKLRVSDDCSLYDERTARFWGDPHFSTLDGLGYTFNGKGEFWLVQTTDSSISIQVRLTPIVNGTATFISAAAIQFSSNVSANAYIDNNAPVVEIGGVAFGVEDVINSTHVGMDGTVYDIDLMAGPDSINQLQNVSFILDAVNNTGISISPSDGSLSVTVRVQSGSEMNVLSVSTDLNAAAVRDKTRGLLGVINDDPTDDFTLLNGTILDINSTEEEIYYQFGLKWRVGREEDSLFVYRGSDTYSSVNNDTSFTPRFGVDLDNIPEDVKNACGGNRQCSYDLVQTGDVGLAESTASEEMELQNTRNILVAPPAINGSAVLRVVAGLDYTTNFTSRGELSLQSSHPQNLTLTDGILVWSTPPHWVPPEQIQIISTLNISGNNITNSLTVFVVLCGCMNGGECIEVATPNFGDGSYYQEECMCHPAYEGVLCENDTNGCRENPCQDPSFCEDVPAPGVGFNCTGCLSGYQLNGATCEDVDECSQDGSCQLHSMCENSPGSFVCVCEEGYSLNNQDCVDIDECTEGIADCQQVCVNNDGSYACQCFTGFTQDPFSGNCSATHPCGVDCGEGQCVTEDGTNKCVCPSGMQYDGTSCSNCPSDRFGFNCSMTCNCMNGGECDRVRGCVCTEGWTGGNCTTKLNNYSPEFRSDEDTMVTISDRGDVGTLVTTLVATDGDSDSAVGYSLQEFQPQSSSMYEDGRPFFSLNSDSGEVRIRRQPDGNGPYLLTVVATDNATEPRQSSPFFLVISVRSNFDKVITLHIMEDATIGTDIDGLRCSENTLLVNVLNDPDQVDVFNIFENGSVVLSKTIDYESEQVYSLDIECLEASGSRQNASARIIVLDVNDNSPQLGLFDTHSSSDLNVIENNPIGESIGRLNFSDADSGSNGNVSFVLDPSNVPVMINSNGEIVMTASVNYEDGTNFYNFTVTAVDGGIPSLSSTPLSFTLNILDEDDPPVFSGLGYVAHMPDYADILPSPLLTVSVSDDDTNSIQLSVDMPWVSASNSSTSQEISLGGYPTELSVNVGSTEYFQDADISPYLDGNQEPFSQESGLPVYLRGTLTATSNEITAVPLYIVVFPRNALIKVSITSGETPSMFKTTADTMATVFTESLNQHTISSSSEYKFEIYSLERNGSKIDMYGYFHNSSEAGPLTDHNLPHNYHFLTQTVTKNILVDDYTQSQLTAALGSSIEYSVEGVTRPSDEPTRPSDEFILSTWIIVGIAAGGFVALLVFFLTGIALGCCLRRRHKAKVGIAHTDEVDTMMLWESPL